MSEGMPKRPEKRHYKRIDMELPVRVEIDGEIIQSTTENISCGGMYMPVSALEFSEKDQLTAFITLPETSKEVRLNGEIRRVQKNTDNCISGIAVEFSGLYDENHLEIDRLIKRWKLPN